MKRLKKRQKLISKIVSELEDNLDELTSKSLVTLNIKQVMKKSNLNLNFS